MKRSFSLLLLALVLTSAACAGKQKTDESATGETQAAAVPTCGDWVVVVEEPVIASGDYAKDALRTALMEGLQGAGCQALTSSPAAAPEGASVLRVTTKATSTGRTAGAISAIATDTRSGNVKWRFQQTDAGDGTEAARTVGRQIAEATGAGQQ